MREVSVYPAKWILERENPKLEIIERRSEKSKTFLVSYNKKTYTAKVVIDMTPIHYKKGNKWEEINLAFVRKNGKVIMEKSSYKIEILKGRVGYKVKFFDGSWYKLELIRVGNEKVKKFKAHFAENQYFWDNISKDIDIKLQLHPAKPETYTQIKSEEAHRVFVWKITESTDFNYKSVGGDMDQNSLEVFITKSKKKGNAFFYQETWTGKVARIMDKRTRIRHWEENPLFPLAFEIVPSYPVYIDPTITKTITANANDGREKQPLGGGSTWRTTRIILGWSTAGVSSHGYNGGFRFTSVNVPVGATINSAKLKIKIKNGGTPDPMKVFGDKVGNAAAWSGTSRPSQITKTTNSTSWTPTVNALNTINITNQVKSIVSLAGWASNNAMRFGAISPTRTHTRKTVNAYDHNTSVANSAKLVITYTSGATAQIYPQLATLGVGV